MYSRLFTKQNRSSGAKKPSPSFCVPQPTEIQMTNDLLILGTRTPSRFYSGSGPKVGSSGVRASPFCLSLRVFHAADKVGRDGAR